MINKVPSNWQYDSSMEMMFLFYQTSEELLNKKTCDTYALPHHNSITLLVEIKNVNNLLLKYNMIDEHYNAYICPLIDEFLHELTSDKILKSFLGERVEKIRNGFEVAKKNPSELELWISLVMQSCTIREYIIAYKNRIIELVNNECDKDELIACIKKYFISLIEAGYTKNYIYENLMYFFNNEKFNICDDTYLKKFLSTFTFDRKEFEFFVLINMDDIEYIDSIDSNFKIMNHLKKVDYEAERETLCQDKDINKLFTIYDKTQKNPKIKKLEIVRMKGVDIDPYNCICDLRDEIEFIQNIIYYFKHVYSYNKVIRILLKTKEGNCKWIRIPEEIQRNNNIVTQTNVINRRIRNILMTKAMSRETAKVLFHVLDLHAESINSKSVSVFIKTFWTALERVFSDKDNKTIKEKVIVSVLSIIQKTYLLKVFCNLYNQLKSAVAHEHLVSIDIDSFDGFVAFFASHENSSTEMRKLSAMLGDNPLLRFRIFDLRKKLKDTKHINSFLEEHKKRIDWQLNRIYRVRNIITHLGIDIKNMESSAMDIHNYFDYIINYILCKTENEHYVRNIPSLVFEAKNDNEIYSKILKQKCDLDGNNYQKLLFGPDFRIIKYNFVV